MCNECDKCGFHVTECICDKVKDCNPKLVVEWISVKKRLPDQCGQYLVFLQRDSKNCPGKIYRRIKVARFNSCYGKHRKPHFFANQTYKVNEITHWMDLPEYPHDCETQGHFHKGNTDDLDHWHCDHCGARIEKVE